MVAVRRKRSTFEGLKGLRSQSKQSVVANKSQIQDDKPDSERLALQLPWSSIVLPDKQPRRYFDKVELEKLAASIREHGILEPLIVRPLADGKYGLVAGERRYRAAKLAQLKQLPVVVRNLNDEQAWEIALLENVQRQDLNAVDKVDAVLQELAFKLNFSIQEAKSALYRIDNENKGKVTRAESGNHIRATVDRVFEILGIRFSQFMRFELPLLKAPEIILTAVRSGKIDVRHANEIRRVKDNNQQKSLLTETIEKQLSVEAVKARVKASKENVETHESSLQARLTKVISKARRSKLWNCIERQKKLKNVLTELEKLLEE